MSSNIAIFASGGGSNAQKIMEHFQYDETVNIALVISNKRDAGVLKIAESLGIETLIIDRIMFYDSESLMEVLRSKNVDLIVLAGFLWLVPAWLVKAYPKRILNIHPALLPKYGGKGMYGMHVHNAVKAAGESETGITIHFVNEHYDEGDIVFQASCSVDDQDSAHDIASKVLALEHAHFAEIIHAQLLQCK